MFNKNGNLDLTPMYDVVSSSYYPQFKELVLKLNKQKFDIGNIKPKNLVILGRDAFGLSKEDILTVISSIEKNSTHAIDALRNFQNEFIAIDDKIKTSLIDIMKKRWNGSFKDIHTFLNQKYF